MEPLQPPREVGRYLLFDAIAAGGMATVYLARLRGNEGFARIVALKQLYPHFAQDQEFVAMFLDEARISSRIRHPNVVAPLDIIVQGSELFIAMEYVHGEALSTLAGLAKGPIAPTIAGAIVVQALLGLHAAHEATGDDGQPLDIVHRDVSPQNILVGADGLARVVDFGIAKATSRARTTQDGRLKGKMGYMAPEQIRQQPADRRVDVFTAGVVLWELLAGRLLFTGDHPAAVLEGILSARVEPPSVHNPAVSPELDAVVLCALGHDPATRFDTAKAMATALSRAVPLASTLEVSAWVEGLAGPGLAARAQRILELERASTGDVPSRGSATPLAPVTPAPRELSQPETDLSLIPSSATDHGPPAARRRVLWAALGASAAAAALVGLALRLQTGQSDQALHAGAPAVDATVQAPAAGSTAVSPSVTPLVEPPASAEGPRAVEPAPRPRPNASTAAEVVPRVSSKPPPATSARRGLPDCKVPYVVDARGIKRFKPECFR